MHIHVIYKCRGQLYGKQEICVKFQDAPKLFTKGIGTLLYPVTVDEISLMLIEYWSALATAPTSASAGAKETSNCFVFLQP